MADFNSEEQQNFKLGISLIIVLLVVLLVIFGVYAFRSKQPATNSSNSTEQKGGLFSRLFGNDENFIKDNDSDNDGLSNKEEDSIGTDSFKTDSDNDGLTDREEKLVYNTDPKVMDTDGDGVNDNDEIKQRRDPKNSDPKAEWPPRPAQFTTASN